MYSVVTPLTVVFDGIFPLPVTNIPVRIPLVLVIGTSFSPLATAPLVLTLFDARLTATSVLDVASNPSAKLFIFLVALLVPIFTALAALPNSRLVTFSL